MLGLLSTQDVGAKAFKLRGDGLNMLGGNLEFREGGAEMFHNGVEMRVIEALIDQLGMSRAHVLSGVVIGASKRHGEKGGLLCTLIVHVGGLKEVRDRIIGQDLSVEDVYSGLNCWSAA